MDINIGTLPVNLPYKYCPSGKNREIFDNYGHNGIIDVGKDGEIICQRMNGDNCVKYTAIHPVLPLSCTAQKVRLSLKDRVMGKTIEQNKALKSFYTRIKQFRSLGKRWGKEAELEDVLSGIDDFKSKFTPEIIESCNNISEYIELVDSSMVDKAMQPWFRDLLKEYVELKDVSTPRFNNYKYAGGCISSIPHTRNCCYIVSAAGHKFDTICLSRAVQTAEGLLQCYKVEDIRLPNTIYGIKSRHVQGQDFVSVRTDKYCYLYYLTMETSDHKLQLIQKTDEQCFSSIDISPYIPCECVLVNTDGKCFLWYADTGSLKSCVDSCEHRFQVTDEWRHVQYGSHPRQLVYADQTSVQLFDLRTSNAEGHDLFSLPSHLLHNRERVRLCGRHPASTFYHLVATDYTLMILDERYPKYPLLTWDHMLSAPPQYMSGMYGSDGSGVIGSDGSRDDNFIYIASQFPADVHAFRFSMKDGLPPISTCLPHRAAKKEDMSMWTQFADKCPNTDVLRNRLQISLAGISTSPWQQGHVVFQLDSHGEIFHQVFSANQSSADITFSAGLGSHDLHPLPVAVDRAQSWIKSWVDNVKEELQSQIKTRDIQTDLWGLYLYRNPHKSCCVCRPDLSFVPGGIDVPDSTAYCETCMVLLQDSQNLVTCTQKDTVLPSTSTYRPYKLKEVSDVPKDTALSKLLMKHWDGDKDEQEIDDILKEWDKEVFEKRKAVKAKPESGKPDMSEESVMRRIQNVEHGQARSRPAHTNSSASMEPGIVSSADDLVHGQESRKRRPSNAKNHSLGSSVKKALKRKVKENRVQRDKRDAVQSDRVSEDNNRSGVSEDKHSVASVVYGSVDSFESRIFQRVNIEEDANIHLLSSMLAQTIQPDTSKPGTCNASVSLFSSPTSQINNKTNNGDVGVFKVPSSGKTNTKRRKHNSQRSSVSEFSVATCSEDLFHEVSTQLELASEEDDRLSSVFSVASCPGLLNSQVSSHVAKNLFSSQPADTRRLEQLTSSPVGISSRKLGKRKHLTGF